MTPDLLDSARRAVSHDGRLHYTRAQLAAELRRRGASAEDIARARSIELVGLIDPTRLARVVDPSSLPPDALLYTTRRLLVCESLDLTICLVRNGFYRRFEIAIAHAGGFPEHVFARIRQTIEEGHDITLFTLESLAVGVPRLPARLDRALVTRPNVIVEDVGLHVDQLEALEIPLSGGCADVEDPPPLALMRWLYSRVAKGREEIGFG